MTLGPVRVIGAGVVVMMCVEEVRCNSCRLHSYMYLFSLHLINVNAFV